MNDRSNLALPRSTRRTRLSIAVLFCAIAFARAGDASSQTFTPIQIALFPVAQIFSEEVPVRGLRLTLCYGTQRDVAGLDAGFINIVTEKVSGIGVGVVNHSRGDAGGVQLAMANAVDGHFRGLQAGAANFNEGELRGAQVGALNVAEDGAGFQLGVYNRAASLKGFQFGLININANGFLPFFPIVNFGF